ncbi:MAG: MBL fold metallo-hydrolase [Acidobacteriota bacterium]
MMKRRWAKGSVAVDILSAEGVVSSSILISMVSEDFLIDVGDGTLKLLKGRDYRFERLHGIFFTHGHYDHIGGLWGLLGYLRFIKRKAPLPIHFPSGSIELQEITALHEKLFALDSLFKLHLKEIREGEAITLGNMNVIPFAARHIGSISGRSELIPAVGYTIIFKDKDAGDLKIVISGDTGPSRKLMDEVRGADYAIIEASFAEDQGILPDTHLSVSQAARIGKLAREFCLVHLTDQSYPIAFKEGLAPED